VAKRSNPPVDPRIKRWNQLAKTDAPFQIRSVKIIESNVFASQTVKLERMIALIGLHGTGKSLFLRMIEAAFGYVAPVYSPPFLKGNNHMVLQSNVPAPEGTVEISLKTPSRIVTHTIDLSEPAETRAKLWKRDTGDSFRAWYADPIGAFNEFSYMYDNYDFTSSCTVSEAEQEVSRSGLDVLRNILGRRYDRVTVRSARVDDELEMPFISAYIGSKKFDNTVMSQGELWAHYTNWFLGSESDRGHLALLDEPEAFLASQGRRPLIDHIARLALSNDRQFMIGTHSPEMLARFPLTHVRMCVPSDLGTRVVTPQSLVQVHDCVGIETPIRSLALVEDDLAKILLSAIFSRFDIALTREVEIIPVGGAPEVLSGHRIMSKAERISCVAVLDGDQSINGSATTSGIDAAFFLPGAMPPEDQLIASTLGSLPLASEMIGSHPDQIFTAINSCRYLDHQYLLRRIAEQLGQSEPVLTQVLVQIWLLQPAISREAETLAAKIRNALSNTES